MKRPSGFDTDPVGDPGNESVGNDRAGGRPERDAIERVRQHSLAESPVVRRALDRSAADQVRPAPEREPEAPQQDPVDTLAPTIDLSEVREAKEAGGDIGAVVVSPVRGVLHRWSRDREEADPVREAERRVKRAGRQRRARIKEERRRFSAESRRRRRAWLISFSVIGGLAVFVVLGAYTPVMAVRDVQIVGAEKVNASDLEQALSRFEGRPLALIDDAAVHAALEPYPMIQRYAVERVPPHTLVVRIEERLPVVSVEADSGFNHHDAAGVLLGNSEGPLPGAPVASGAASDFSSRAFTAASESLRDMPEELRARITAVTASSAQDVTFTLDNGVTVIWGGSDQTARKAVVLQSMLSALADRAVEQIDVTSTEAPVFK